MEQSTQQIIDFVNDNPYKFTAVEIAEKFNNQRSRIYDLARAHQLPVRKDNKKSVIIAFIRENAGKLKAADVAKRFHVTVGRIYTICKVEGLELKSGGKKSQFAKSSNIRTYSNVPHKRIHSDGSISWIGDWDPIDLQIAKN